MKQLADIYEGYLAQIGWHGEVVLGESSGTDHRVTADNNLLLAKALDQRLRINKYFVIVIFGFLSMLFLIVTGSALYYGGGKWSVYAFGTLLLSNLGIIAWLHRLWWQMNFMDICMYLLRELPADRAADLVGQLYWAFARSSSKTSKELKH